MNHIDNNTPRQVTPPSPANTETTDQSTTTTAEPEAPKPRRPRGFAAMDRKLVTELARKGGKAAHLLGAAHEFNSDEAREAGRKGGLASHVKRRARDAAVAAQNESGPESKSSQG
jgi:general stress protein YciG